MKIIIPWSGGLDSSALIYKRLTEGHEVILEKDKAVAHCDEERKAEIDEIKDKTADVGNDEKVQIELPSLCKGGFAAERNDSGSDDPDV